MLKQFSFGRDRLRDQFGGQVSPMMKFYYGTGDSDPGMSIS